MITCRQRLDGSVEHANWFASPGKPASAAHNRAHERCWINRKDFRAARCSSHDTRSHTCADVDHGLARSGVDEIDHGIVDFGAPHARCDLEVPKDRFQFAITGIAVLMTPVLMVMVVAIVGHGQLIPAAVCTASMRRLRSSSPEANSGMIS